ncbi:unnamed protein product [Rotaria socialis]|nr:unnamed protein product [Rotaria socialis]
MSNYEYSSYSSSSSAGDSVGDFDATKAIIQASRCQSKCDAFDADADPNIDFDVVAVNQSAGLYVDANPDIICRPTAGAVQTYIQNIKPLIFHERLPRPPVAQTSQIVIRNLPASPESPGSVIIERTPATPYQPLVIKRKTIVQRVDADKKYFKPRNIIIQYEHLQVRVVQQFQRYGAQWLDVHMLLQQVRVAGVVEDISPPTDGVVSTVGLSSSFSQESSFGSNGSVSVVELTNLLGGSGFTGVGFDNSLAEGTAVTVNSADKNKGGLIAANEFKQFYQGGL